MRRHRQADPERADYTGIWDDHLTDAQLTEVQRRRLAARTAEARVLIETARADREARRERVLRYPDLARRLVTEAGYARPEQWNGYVPPRHVSGRVAPADKAARGSDVLNLSRARAVLVQICADALQREATPDGAHG